MGLVGETADWCKELAGDYYEAAFVWQERKLVALIQRDIWLTDEPIEVMFDGHQPPPQLGEVALNW